MHANGGDMKRYLRVVAVAALFDFSLTYATVAADMPVKAPIAPPVAPPPLRLVLVSISASTLAAPGPTAQRTSPARLGILARPLSSAGLELGYQLAERKLAAWDRRRL